MDFQREYDRNFKCCDCKHSQASFMNRLLKLSAGFKCTLPESKIKEKYDPVTGTTTPGFYQYCSTVRLDNLCGPKANAWEPRNKKHLFLMFQKECIK